MRILELDKSKGAAPKGPAGQPKPQGAPAGKGAPGGKGPAGKKPANGPPELPKTLNPSDVHSYYMSMASYHDNKAWMNKRISGLKPLWSDDRTMHDDRHLFHKAMRDGFAQKALAVDLAAPMDGESGFGGMKESIQESVSPERIQVGHDVHTLEEFVEHYGETPLQALRSGRITRFSIIGEAKAPSCWGCGYDWKARWESHDLASTKKSSQFGGSRICPDCVGEAGVKDTDFAVTPNRRTSIGPKGGDTQIPVYQLAATHHMCGNCGWAGQKSDATHCPNCRFGKLRTVDHTGKEVSEAFSGTAPTGALNTINNNKSSSSKPLPMKSPFPSNAPKPAAAKVPTVPKVPTMPKTTEATVRVADGENVTDVLSSLLNF